MNWALWHRTGNGRRAAGVSRWRPGGADPGRDRPPRWPLAVAGLCAWAACSVAVSYRRTPPPVRFVVGEIADRNVYSEIPFRYADAVQTERLRDRAARDVPPVYRLSKPAVENALQNLSGLREALRNRPLPAGDRPSPAAPGSDAPAAAPGAAPPPAGALDGLGKAAIEALSPAFLDQPRFRVLQDLVSYRLNAGIMEEREITSLREPDSAVPQVSFVNDAAGVARTSLIRTEELRDPKQAAAWVAAEFAGRYPDAGEALSGALELVLSRVLRPTMVRDLEATQKAARQAAAAVETVMRFVGANEVLVLRGEKVTQEMIDRLEKHQQELHLRQTTQMGFLGFLQGPLVCAVLVLCAGAALLILEPSLPRNPHLLAMVTLVLVLHVALDRTVAVVHVLNGNPSFYLLPLLPLSFSGMLLAPLAGMRSALAVAALAAAVEAWQIRSPEAFHLTLMGFATAFTAAWLMHRARRRLHLIRAGSAVFGTVLLLETLFFLRGTLPPGALGRALLPLVSYAAANAFGVTALVFLLIPLLEFAFGVASDMTLVELGDLNHPLMKRLQLEAPGTYHHSLTVATLAEQAAEAIGANALLARVSAYFHDIGKLERPEFFTENAIQGANPHDGLQPRLSSLVILDHVRKGIELARRYKLVRPLREAIAQHHGTSLVYFFYRKAQDQSPPGQAPGESEFRYPGPRPRRKEVVLVSLADTCEAASRSLERPTPVRVEALVDSLIQDRIRGHELDDADLTFSELARVRDTLVRTLTTMLHARVAYPKGGDHEPGSVQGRPAPAPEGPPGPPDGVA